MRFDRIGETTWDGFTKRPHDNAIYNKRKADQLRPILVVGHVFQLELILVASRHDGVGLNIAHYVQMLGPVGVREGREVAFSDGNIRY